MSARCSNCVYLNVDGGNGGDPIYVSDHLGLLVTIEQKPTESRGPSEPVSAVARMPTSTILPFFGGGWGGLGSLIKPLKQARGTLNPKPWVTGQPRLVPVPRTLGVPAAIRGARL